MSRICESCGMNMVEPEQYANEDENSIYCIHCVDEFGNLKSFEKKVEDMRNMLMSNMNITAKEAEDIVKNKLKDMPAWKDKF